MQRAFFARLLLCSAFLGAEAHAHLWLNDPPARHPADDLKYGPCGVGTPDARTTNPNLITTFEPGETITVTWTETIDHDPSHYRIMFSQDGDTQFLDPTGFDDTTTLYPELLDGIPDANAGNNHVYSVQVTLPEVTCDECTLQVIQVMHDKPPWGPEGGDDIYYQCADIVIAEEGNTTGAGGSPNQVPGTGGSTTAGGGSGGSGDASPPGAGGASTHKPENPSSSRENEGPVTGCSMGPNSARKQKAPGPMELSLLGALLALARRRLRSAPAASLRLD